MNCDSIAAAYRWLEYLRFGRSLQNCRLAMLRYTDCSKSALLLGDGDGRFLTALAIHNPGIKIDAVDVSRKMLRLACRRVQWTRVPDTDRIRFQLADIETWTPGSTAYDLVASHFFFDVFATGSVAQIVEQVRKRTCPGALWLVSEFEVPHQGWRHFSARLWLAIMYRFFRLTTGLRTQQLPKWRPILQQAGFIQKEQQRLRGGFLVSELWQRIY
jgi:cyclopropane fatty-acyl-phospholipid synthase-like methyltransferase